MERLLPVKTQNSGGKEILKDENSVILGKIHPRGVKEAI